MYFFLMIFGIIYWLIYGNWIGGCLTASLFLVAVFSIYVSEKEKNQMELLIELNNRILTENDVLEILCKIKGRRFQNTRHCELEYVTKSVLHGKERKKSVQFLWGKMEKTDIFMKQKFKTCDLYKIRFICLKWKDMTGLYTVKKEFLMEEEFLVMPKRFLLETMNDKIRKMQMEQDGFEYDGIRTYRPGDKMSKIHWKLFAGNGELYVRKSENEAMDPVAIGLDISSLEKKQYSDYFSIFYSISGFFLDKGIPQKIYFGNSSYVLQSLDQYEELFTKIFCEDLTQSIVSNDKDMLKIPFYKRGQNVEDYLYDMEL